MTSRNKISTTKPDAPTSRFALAQKFASDNTDKAIEPETQTSDMPALKEKKKATETMRENFDLDLELGKEMRQFILNSRRFRTKRDFLTQCLRDGLEKYKDQ
jgi:hypothetical protein